MSKGHVVVDGAICKCKFGATPDVLTVQSQTKAYINDSTASKKLIANTMDLGMPFQAKTFGPCKLKPTTGGHLPCVPAITQWQNPYDKVVLSNNGQILTENSKAACATSGSPSVEFTFHGQVATGAPAPPSAEEQEAISHLDPLASEVALEVADGALPVEAEEGSYNSKSPVKKSPFLFFNRKGSYLCGPVDDAQHVYITEIALTLEEQKTQEQWDQLKESAVTLKNDTNTSLLTYKDFKHFAATVLGESSAGFNVIIEKEIFALASANHNFKVWYKARKNKDITYRTVISKTGAYATTSKQYKLYFKKKDADRNNFTAMLYANAAVINAITGGIDHSNGAIKWSGIDIISDNEKWNEGYVFSNESHDLFSLGSNYKSGKTWWKNALGQKTKVKWEWEYKWKSTAAFGGTNSALKNIWWEKYLEKTNNPNIALEEYCDNSKDDSVDVAKKKTFFENKTKHLFGTIFSRQTDNYIKAQGGEFY